MPSASFTHTVHVDTSIDGAWAALQSAETWAGIGPISSVSNAVVDSDGVLRSFAWTADLGGKTYRGTTTTTEAVVPERFAIDLDNSEIGGTVLATLAERDGGCDVTVTLGLTTKGMLSAMFFPAIKQALASGFPQQVEDLASAL
jgi:hypothetical protein